jgi:threonine dehydratase
MEDSTAPTVTLRDIEAARERIAGFAVRTPLVRVPWNESLWLKLENLQVTGSFKVRGAASRITLLPAGRGVVTASSGNHGQAVAYVARRNNRPATVVVPEDVPEVKAQAITHWGARLIRHGHTSEERVAFAQELAEEYRLLFVPPYDDEAVIAGQGTIALEIYEELPTVRQVVVPVSGGGLISGIAAGIKALSPGVEVVGVEPAELPRFARSRLEGRRVRLAFRPTIADGLRVIEPGRLTWEVAGSLVDRFVNVSDERILKAVRRLATDAHLVVEPSGAVGLAAVEEQGARSEGATAVVLSGGNIDPRVLASALVQDSPLA